MNGKDMSMMMVAVVSLALLAGCANNPSEAIKNGIGNVAESVGDTANNVISDWSEELNKEGIHKNVSLKQEIGSASALLLENEVGSIDVTATTDDQITINATFSFPNKPSNETKYQEIIDHTEISIITKGKQLEIVTHPKGNKNMNMWQWVKKEYGFTKFSINYTVELPDTVNRYEIESDVGIINLHNLKGVYDVSSDVGAIDIEGAEIQGKSSIESDVGNIQLGINQMESDSALEVDTDVGSIKVVLAEGLPYSLKVDSDLGQVVGASKGKSDINGGGPLISLNSSVGSITVEERK